jgi:hypothetical protein
LRVRLEPGTINSITGDLAPGGVFVHSHRLLRPGTAVRLEIGLPEGRGEAHGVVRWAKRVPPQLSRFSRGGMGIEFTWISEELRAYLGGTQALSAEAV